MIPASPRVSMPTQTLIARHSNPVRGIAFGKILTLDPADALHRACIEQKLTPAEIINFALARNLSLGEGHEAKVIRSPQIPEICVRIPHQSAQQQQGELTADSFLSFRAPNPLRKPNGDPLFIEPFADVTDSRTGAVFQLLPRIPGTAIARSFTDRAATHYLGALFHKRLERQRQKNPDLSPEALAEAVCLKPGEPYQWGKIPSTPSTELGYYKQFLRFQHAYPRMMASLARLPQDAYTDAVETIRRCQSAGVTLDFFHGNNTILANGKELVFIDTMKPGERPLHDACSTPMGMFYGLTENYEPPVAARTRGHLAEQLLHKKTQADTQQHHIIIRERILSGIRDVYGRQAEAEERVALARGVFYGRTPDGGRQLLKGASSRVFPKGGLQPLPIHRQLRFFAGRALGKGWLWGKGNRAPAATVETVQKPTVETKRKAA